MLNVDSLFLVLIVVYDENAGAKCLQYILRLCRALIESPWM